MKRDLDKFCKDIQGSEYKQSLIKVLSSIIAQLFVPDVQVQR